MKLWARKWGDLLFLAFAFTWFVVLMSIAGCADDDFVEDDSSVEAVEDRPLNNRLSVIPMTVNGRTVQCVQNFYGGVDCDFDFGTTTTTGY